MEILSSPEEESESRTEPGTDKTASTGLDSGKTAKESAVERRQRDDEKRRKDVRLTEQARKMFGKFGINDRTGKK